MICYADASGSRPPDEGTDPSNAHAGLRKSFMLDISYGSVPACSNAHREWMDGVNKSQVLAMLAINIGR